MFRTTRFRVAGLIALALYCFAAAAPSSAQTTLRYKYKEGEKLDYVMEQKMTMQMSGAGMDLTMAIQQNLEMKWETGKVATDGSAVIKQKIGRIVFDMDAGPKAGKIKYDSKDGKKPEGPVGEIMGPLFDALAGAEFSMKVNARGEIGDVTIPDALAKAMKKLGGAGGADMFSEEGMKRMMTQSGLVLPEKAIDKGKSWEQKTEMKMPPLGTMKMTNTLTYEGSTEKGGKTLEQVSMKPTVKFGVDEASPVTVKLKSQDIKGNALFDNKAGRLVETNLDQKMEMEISGNGMVIEQKLTQSITLKLAK